MHHADPATLALAGAQARCQGGCFGETLPLLSSSTPDTPLAARPLLPACREAGRSLPCRVACQVRLLVGCALVQRMGSDASNCVCLRRACDVCEQAGGIPASSGAPLERKCPGSCGPTVHAAMRPVHARDVWCRTCRCSSRDLVPSPCEHMRAGSATKCAQKVDEMARFAWMRPLMRLRALRKLPVSRASYDGNTFFIDNLNSRYSIMSHIISLITVAI